MNLAKALICFLFLSNSLYAQAELPNCDDLTIMANELDQVAEALTEVEQINQGDDLDRALGELVDALQAVAQAENSAEFDRVVDKLTRGYNQMNSDVFEGALDQIIAYMDKMNRRDCY